MKKIVYPKYDPAFRPFSNPLLFFVKMFRVFPRREYYLINAMPKSGSTYLYNLLTKLLKVKKLHIKNQWYRATEQDLYIPALLDARIRKTLSRHHFKATDLNIDLMMKFNIKPIILVRNIFDLVVSFRDNLENGLKETGSCPWGYSSTGYVNESFLKLDKERQFDYIIDICLPWFFSFYSSWRVVNEAGFDVFWLTYEDLVSDPAEALKNISQFYLANKNNEEISNAVNIARQERELNNFNIGIQGRGEKELNKTQMSKIKNFARYYPSINFEAIGI